MNGHYYNEWDKHAAQWLRNLMAAGLIPEGDVDERSIVYVQPDDLRGYVQCHFFAGIGGWPYALSLAGWDKDEPVWTGSCPCQPFSVAGAGKGTADERHLWPAFRRLIAESKPATVFGEQVASKDGRLWLAGVRADLEALGYACGAVDISAAGVGAPHIRQRLYWVGRMADASSIRREQRRTGQSAALQGSSAERTGQYEESGQTGELQRRPQGLCSISGLGDTTSRRSEMALQSDEHCRAPTGFGETNEFRGTSSPWSDYTFIPFRDGKSRRIEPGLEPLVNGLPFKLADGRTREGASRTQILKGLGNAIVPPLAAEFIRAYMEKEQEQT